MRENKIQSILLPRLGFDVVLDDKDGASSVAQNLEDDLTAFLEDVIETSDGVDTLDYVSFNFDIILSSFGRRRLETGLSIVVDGTAYYGETAPSRDELTKNFQSYFSTWGMQDLQTYLQVVGLSSSQIVAVSIDGVKVKEADTSEGYNPGAEVVNPAPEGASRGSSMSPGIFAGVIAVGTLCLLTLFYFLVQFCTMPSSDYEAYGWGIADTDTVAAAAEPKIPHKKDSTEDENDDVDRSTQSIAEQSENIGSDDTSIYTNSENWEQTSQEGTHAYDANRLDRLIEVARKHSDVSNGTGYV